MIPTLSRQFTWTDRRPIAALHVADEAHRSLTNPAGWLFDPTIDITTQAGLLDFKLRVITSVNTALSIMRRINAQGMIMWDADGARYGTYLGCPDLALDLNPELNIIGLGSFFLRFRVAGFRCGVCIRPVEFNFETSKLEDSTDPFATLYRKAKFAHDRLGCTLFYVDSNGDPNLPLPATIFARLQKSFPDCLFIPEHEDRSYYLFTAPYLALENRETSTPQSVRDDIEDAFGVININTGDIQTNFNSLKAAVNRGDILLVDGGWEHPRLADTVKLYTP